MYVHESVLKKKIKDATKKGNVALQTDLTTLYATYMTYRTKMEAINYSLKVPADFNNAAGMTDQYLLDIEAVVARNGIKSQGKLRSSLLEELSYYLFEDYPKIKAGTLSVMNKKIYAGLAVNKALDLELYHKDVDFCIGKKTIL